MGESEATQFPKEPHSTQPNAPPLLFNTLPEDYDEQWSATLRPTDIT